LKYRATRAGFHRNRSGKERKYRKGRLEQLNGRLAQVGRPAIRTETCETSSVWSSDDIGRGEAERFGEPHIQGADTSVNVAQSKTAMADELRGCSLEHSG